MGSRKHTVSFTVALPVARTWAVMSDTQHLNQLFFGFQELRLVSRDAEKARIRGTFGALAPEYDEYPWVFEVPHHYKSVRVFTRGVLRRMESECRLKDGGSNDTVVEYGLKLDTIGGPIGALAAWEGVRRMKLGLARAQAFLAKLRADAAPVWPAANPHREAVLQRARALADGVHVVDDDERAAIGRLIGHLAEAPEPDVARMRPYALAGDWGLPRKKTLGAFLRATQGKLLRLSWDLLCPSCEGASSFAHLKDVPAGAHCPACDIDFAASFDQNIEATFSPEPAVRAAERLVFCHGSPQATRSWIAQFVVDARGTHELQVTLGAGRYRLQAAGIQGSTLLDVEEGGAESVRIGIEPLQGEVKLPTSVPLVRPGRVKIVVENKDAVPRRVQLAHRAFASQSATAADVTATGLFKELFGGEALSPEQHLEVGQRAVLFTDLCGSTALYERVGDAAAYALVREHFKLLFLEVERHGGRVVKTVGDCVMAAFDTPEEAARAGKQSILALRQLEHKDGGAPQLQLKVGVHAGPCLAVEANGQVDYFGRTVNIAARVESLANPDELVLSWTAVADAGVTRFIDEARLAGDAILHDKRPVKGISGDVEIVRVQVRP